jgi:beta-galactosidase GanA
VLMMQVENEVGVLGSTRDHSDVANRAFASAVPGELLRYLDQHHLSLNPELRALWEEHGAKTSGTWTEVFGDSPRADEIFMAWHYAKYVQAVAAKGKAAYDLPMYVNTWLGGEDAIPGNYPSGGPQPRVIDVWKVAGTAIDLYAPDLYSPDVYGWRGAIVARTIRCFCRRRAMARQARRMSSTSWASMQGSAFRHSASTTGRRRRRAIRRRKRRVARMRCG